MDQDPSARQEPRRVQSAVDRAELRDIAMRYARAVDRRDRELLLSCYHPDGVDHHGTMFNGNAAAYADWQPEIMAQFAVTAHYIMNTDYCIDGDVAEGEIYFIAYHRLAPPTDREAIVGGRYHDRYERRDGEWRILHRSIVWDFARDNALDLAQFGFLRSLGNIGAGADDASFETRPLLAGRKKA